MHRTLRRCCPAEVARRAFLAASPQYPAFDATHSIASFVMDWSHLEKKARVEGEDVAVAGRIVSKRELSAKLYFLDVVQGGKRVQIMSERQHWAGAGDADTFRATHQSLRRGDIIGVRGFPGKSARGELSVIPRDLSVLAPCLRPIPTEREGLVDPELRFGRRYLDLLVNPVSLETLRTRSRVTRFIRDFFHGEGFEEVETPTLWPSASGASAAPFVTERASASDGGGGGSGSSDGGRELFLRIAPELFLKQLVIGGMDKVFELGKVFRNEGVTPRHNPEFTMCEAYAAYWDRDDLMAMTERLLSALVYELNDGSYTVTVEQRPAEGSAEGSAEAELIEFDFTPPFKRVSMLSELERLLDAPGLSDAVLAAQRAEQRAVAGAPEREGEHEDAAEAVRVAEALLSTCCDQTRIVCPAPRTVPRLLDRLTSELIERPATSPIFVCDQPLSLSPLAKEHGDAARAGLADRFELLVAGQELANAYVELSDPEEQRARFAHQDALAERGDDDAVRKDMQVRSFEWTTTTQKQRV